MTVTERFQPYVYESNSVTCEVAGFEIITSLVRDDYRDTPDQPQDGS